MIPAIAMAATPSANQAVVKQLALNAYCSEAQSKSTSMANGSTSYKRIAELASNRALADHPGIYSDSSAWEYIISGLLDQYGDEPTSQSASNHAGRSGRMRVTRATHPLVSSDPTSAVESERR